MEIIILEIMVDIFKGLRRVSVTKCHVVCLKELVLDVKMKVSSEICKVMDV